MNAQPEAKRKGRPAGSNSFERVRLKDLISIMGENSVVPVSAVWLREQGLEIAPLVNISIPAAIEQAEAAPVIEFKLESFGDDDEEENDDDE